MDLDDLLAKTHDSTIGVIVLLRDPIVQNDVAKLHVPPTSLNTFSLWSTKLYHRIAEQTITAPVLRAHTLDDGSIALSIRRTDLDSLRASPIVSRVIENRIFEVPHDEDIGPAAVVDREENWGASYWKIRAFWNSGYSGKGVRVGVLDSGLSLDSQGTSGIRLQEFISFDPSGTKAIVPAYDSQWHGTLVSSIIAGGESDLLRGIAPDVDLYVGKVLQGWKGTPASIGAGLTWMSEVIKPQVLNLSLGWPGLHDEWYEPIRKLLSEGTIVCVAVGNEFTEGPKSRSPGNYGFKFDEGFLSIGAHDRRGIVWARSGGEIGDWPATSVLAGRQFSVPYLVAPGADIVGTAPEARYRLESGSSMAAPHVSGLIALLLQNMPRSRVLSILRNSLQDDGEPGFDIRFGYGRIDICKVALQVGIEMGEP